VSTSAKFITCQVKTQRFTILSYTMLGNIQVASIIESKQFPIVILDESHYIKNRNSKRSKHAQNIIKYATVKMMLSGTPFSYPVHMYPQIVGLYPNLYPWFFHFSSQPPPVWQDMFVLRYCDPHFQVETNRWNLNGCDHDREFAQIMATFVIRRSKMDILSYLPMKTRSCVRLPLLDKEKIQEIQHLLADDKGRESFMSAFRLTCQYKITQVVHYVTEQIIPKLHTDRTLIFAHHVRMREAVEACLLSHKVPFCCIHGGTNSRKRTQIEIDFQTTDKYQVAVLSIEAACTGLNLTRANVVVFTEIMFGPEIMQQAEDRVHRIGQEKEVNVIYLLLPNSTDDINWGLVTKKFNQCSNLLDQTPTRLTFTKKQKKKKWITKRKRENVTIPL
jgi:SWI/SNF-related matrix-associated actin-dependent regulator 1 of chromatin subfamily A